MLLGQLSWLYAKCHNSTAITIWQLTSLKIDCGFEKNDGNNTLKGFRSLKNSVSLAAVTKCQNLTAVTFNRRTSSLSHRRDGNPPLFSLSHLPPPLFSLPPTPRYTHTHHLLWYLFRSFRVGSAASSPARNWTRNGTNCRSDGESTTEYEGVPLLICPSLLLCAAAFVVFYLLPFVVVELCTLLNYYK